MDPRPAVRNALEAVALMSSVSPQVQPSTMDIVTREMMDVTLTLAHFTSGSLMEENNWVALFAAATSIEEFKEKVEKGSRGMLT